MNGESFATSGGRRTPAAERAVPEPSGAGLLARSGGGMAIRAWRLWLRLRNKLFTTLVRGAFHGFGPGSVIQLPATLWGEAHISLGRRVQVGPASWLLALRPPETGGDAVIRLGDGCSLAGGVTITAVKRVTLGDKVLIGRNVHISDHGHRFDDTEVPIVDQGVTDPAPVEIGDGTWIGQGVVVCPGVRIGRHCVIGANSVVRSNIPDYAVAAGAPARVLRSLRS